MRRAGCSDWDCSSPPSWRGPSRSGWPGACSAGCSGWSAFASKLAAGEAPPYLAPERPDDLGVLEAQLGEMARRVGGTIGELRVERERLEAILRGMVEGVLVTDLDGRGRAAERPRTGAARAAARRLAALAARWSS